MESRVQYTAVETADRSIGVSRRQWNNYHQHCTVWNGLYCRHLYCVEWDPTESVDPAADIIWQADNCSVVDHMVEPHSSGH